MKRKKVKELDSKKNWIVNCIVDKVVSIIPKNKRIWIFGAWLGNKYSDNSKYLYEYVKEKEEIKAYWITKNKELYNKLYKFDKNVLYYKSFKAIYIRLIAGVVCYTNSLYDLGNILIHSRAYKVALWHGMPLKKIYYDNKRFKSDGIKAVLKEIKRVLFTDVKRNMTISTSNKCSETLKSAFKIREDKIFITGQPRNDVFFNVSNNLNININLSRFDNILLYMPTYRANDISSSKFNDLLKSLVESNKIQETLDKSNSCLLIKTHYLVDKPQIYNKRIIFVDDKEIEDIQQLIAKSDMLITDYSSCFIDFLITNKPIIFLANDIEEYINSENGFYYNYREITKGNLCEDIDQFNDMIEKYLIKRNYIYNNYILNDIFNDNRITFSYSENVYKAIKKQIKI